MNGQHVDQDHQQSFAEKQPSQHPLDSIGAGASASPPPFQLTTGGFCDAPIQTTYGSATTGPIPDRLEYNSSAMATTAALVLIRGDFTGGTMERTFGSGGGPHAEEKLIHWLQEQVDNGVLVPTATHPHYIASIFLSKSPCSSTAAVPTRTDGNLGCHERLENLRVHGLTNAATGANVTFAVQIGSTKPYQGGGAGGKASSVASSAGFGAGDPSSGSFPFVR